MKPRVVPFFRSDASYVWRGQPARYLGRVMQADKEPAFMFHTGDDLVNLTVEEAVRAFDAGDLYDARMGPASGERGARPRVGKSHPNMAKPTAPS